jgi:hypothetical protein
MQLYIFLIFLSSLSSKLYAYSVKHVFLSYLITFPRYLFRCKPSCVCVTELSRFSRAPLNSLGAAGRRELMASALICQGEQVSRRSLHRGISSALQQTLTWPFLHRESVCFTRERELLWLRAKWLYE